jgi:hypothetical protein
VRQLHRLLSRGLQATAALWPALLAALAWVHQAASVLANHDAQPAAQVQDRYQALLTQMAAGREAAGPLAPAVDHFLRVSSRYAPGLFHTYTLPGVPRTNNDLEQCFGKARYQQRRASGRKRPDASTVVRGAVRLVAAVLTRHLRPQAADLRPPNLARWRALRQQLTWRQETRRAQRRFRHDPAAYMAKLEADLLKLTLPD